MNIYLAVWKLLNNIDVLKLHCNVYLKIYPFLIDVSLKKKKKKKNINKYNNNNTYVYILIYNIILILY